MTTDTGLQKCGQIFKPLSSTAFTDTTNSYPLTCNYKRVQQAIRNKKSVGTKLPTHNGSVVAKQGQLTLAHMYGM